MQGISDGNPSIARTIQYHLTTKYPPPPAGNGSFEECYIPVVSTDSIEITIRSKTDVNDAAAIRGGSRIKSDRGLKIFGGHTLQMAGK